MARDEAVDKHRPARRGIQVYGLVAVDPAAHGCHAERRGIVVAVPHGAGTVRHVVGDDAVDDVDSALAVHCVDSAAVPVVVVGAVLIRDLCRAAGDRQVRDDDAVQHD